MIPNKTKQSEHDFYNCHTQVRFRIKQYWSMRVKCLAKGNNIILWRALVRDLCIS